MSKAKEYLKRVGLIQSPYISQERVIKHLEAFAKEQIEAITVTRCCTPKGTVKTINFERTIDLLDAEIDSLKDAYHQETITDRKTVYSSMILESLHAKKKLKE